MSFDQPGSLRGNTFHEYLRLRRIKGTGDVTAMKTIMDPKLDWDKSFISPALSKSKTKSTLDDRATFWGESATEAAARHLSNSKAQVIRNKKSSGKFAAVNRNDDTSCALCRKSIDIFCELKWMLSLLFISAKLNLNSSYVFGLELILADSGIATCNRVAKCGQVFHVSCLTAQNYDIGKEDGCIMCKGLSKFKISNSSNEEGKKDGPASTKTKASSPSTKRRAAVSATATSKESTQAPKRQKVGNTTKPTASTNPYASTAPTSTASSSASKKKRDCPSSDDSKKNQTTSSSTGKKRQKTTKPPPEKVYINRPIIKPQSSMKSIKRTSFDGNGCSSNPLHDVDRSVAAALLLDEDTSTAKRDERIGSTSGKKRKSTNGTSTNQDEDDVSCGICSKSIDIFAESDIVPCNRVSQCGAIFHQSCLTTHKYDIQSQDGCIKCKTKSLFLTKSTQSSNKNGSAGKASPKDATDLILLDSDDDDNEDDVIIID